MKKSFIAVISFLYLNTISFADITIAYAVKNGITKPAPHQKIDTDKLTKIAEANNIKLILKPLPWKRALLLVEKGRIDGVINASYKKNRLIYAVYPMVNNKLDSSRRLNDGMSYYIYKNRSSTLKWDGKNFINPDGAVGVMAKYAVVENLKKHSNITIREFDDNPEIIRSLATKKIAGYAGASIVVNKILKKYQSLAKNIVRESIPIRKKDYYLIFSKKTYKQKSQDMETIWNGLKNYNKN